MSNAPLLDPLTADWKPHRSRPARRLGTATRVALLGAGRFGSFILEAATALEEILPVAVIDDDPSRAQLLADRHGARVLTVEEALRDEAIDAVVIATPPATHAQLSTAALNAGKDVFCEKPLGVTAAEASSVRDLAEQIGGVVVVDHVLRYNLILQAVRAVQDELGLTPIRFLFENDAADESLPREHWFWQQSRSGGIFIEHGVHFFDAATMFLDTPASTVTASAVSRPDWPAPDLVSATVTHGSALATHTHSFTHAHRCERQLMRIDYGSAEARITGWIPVQAHLSLFTGDEQFTRLHELVRRPLLPAGCAGRQVELTIDGVDRGGRARGRGQTFEGSRLVQLAMSLGGEPAKQAVYAQSVAAALADLHACRTDPGRRPRSSAATAAAAVATAECATRAAQQHQRIDIPTDPRKEKTHPMSDATVQFPLGPFTPSPKNPILSPQGDTWESGSVYNPAAVIVNDQVALLYRAHADDIISHVGLAFSDDGITFTREPEPVLSPSEDYEKFGCEDPRITKIDGTYYLTYSGWDRDKALLCLATSTDLRTWKKHGPLFPDFDTFQPQGQGPERPGPWSKAGGILPVKVNGKYLMYFGEGSIWSATSEDLLHWTPTTPDSEPPIMAPRPGTFTDFLVEVGPPPLVTDNGLILLIHNAAIKNEDGSVRYTAGQLLFHPDEPNRILAELTSPWIEPTTHEDKHGLISNVTFVEGLVFFHGTWFAYYGQSDSTLAVATFTPGQRYSDLT